MNPYPLVGKLLGPVLRVAMPCVTRLNFWGSSLVGAADAQSPPH